MQSRAGRQGRVGGQLGVAGKHPLPPEPPTSRRNHSTHSMHSTTHPTHARTHAATTAGADHPPASPPAGTAAWVHRPGRRGRSAAPPGCPLQACREGGGRCVGGPAWRCWNDAHLVKRQTPCARRYACAPTPTPHHTTLRTPARLMWFIPTSPAITSTQVHTRSPIPPSHSHPAATRTCESGAGSSPPRPS